MPRESVRFLSVDQYFQLPNSSHICAQRLRDGIHSELFAENSRRGSRREFVGKIRDGCSVRLNIESQQSGIRCKRAALRSRCLRDQCNSVVASNARPDPLRAEAGWAWPRAPREKTTIASTSALLLVTSVGVEIGTCMTSRRASCSVLGFPLHALDSLAQARKRDEAQHHQRGKNRDRCLETSRHGAICPPTRRRCETRRPRAPRRQRAQVPS